MQTYGWTRLNAVLSEPNSIDMIREQHAELGGLPLAPDWDEMRRLEERGVFKVWTAHIDGTLAGFILFQLYRHLNFSTTLCAIDGGHYLSLAFRGQEARIWFRMWRTAEQALRGLGVKMILAHDNAKHPLMAAFLSLGYDPAGVVFRKAL